MHSPFTLGTATFAGSAYDMTLEDSARGEPLKAPRMATTYMGPLGTLGSRPESFRRQHAFGLFVGREHRLDFIWVVIA
jgi:hypothetical protein